ncbi:MAG: ThuA domain-containing protein [Gemmataceae bacterium]|nr:ThuA domain-containing protein [Gemmataceae bacterium]
MSYRASFAVWLVPVALLSVHGGESNKVRVVIIDGQNNHDWRSTTPFMAKVLRDCGRFEVDVATAPQFPTLAKPVAPAKPKDDSDPKAAAKYQEALARYREALAKYEEALPHFKVKFQEAQDKFQNWTIDFDRYDVVVSNYNGQSWPKHIAEELEAAVRTGKIGLVIVHAANNAFTGWKEYNRMIGMGWRNRGFGKRLKFDDAGQPTIVPPGEDLDTGHRYTGPFKIVIRDPNHPITRGMPLEWMHARDELYDNLRGPIENVQVLATAIAPKGKGTEVHEPMIFTISYGQGRVFHTPMGHDLVGMRCLGFIATLQRGTEWAATGTVTIPLPANFPTATKESSLPK